MATGVVIYTDNDYQGTGGGKVQGANGILFVGSPWDAPMYTTNRGEDQGIPTTATEAFNSQTASYVRVTVAQFANTGVDHEFADVYFAFNCLNAAQAAIDLADNSVRRALSVQAGIGESRVFAFEKGSVEDMWYKSTNSSADLVIRWEWING